MKRLCLFTILILFVKGLSASETLSEQQIFDIYNNFVRVNDTEEYKNRYVTLPEENTPNWSWKGKDFPRVIACLEFERFIKESGITSSKALAINGIDPEWGYLQTENLVNIDYEANPIKYDLHQLDLDDTDFDFVMVNQTLEHVYDPLLCLRNIYKCMAPGGILYFNVPALNIPHCVPFHFYTGFTPVGIGALVTLAGFEILSIGQWGNLEFITKLFQTHSWPDYTQLNNAGYNEIQNPVVTWVFAIK